MQFAGYRRNLRITTAPGKTHGPSDDAEDGVEMGMAIRVALIS